MYQRLQAFLPDYTVESVTMENLYRYEPVFYNNEKYYYLTDGCPATREICVETICGFTSYHVHSIGISKDGEAVSFLSVLEEYPDADTLYVGLLLVDDRFKRQAIGTAIMKALIAVSHNMAYKKIQLSVQENNASGLAFWKKLGFYEINRRACQGFDNLSMRFDCEGKG